MRQSKNNEDFLTFWKAYPLHRSRLEAERAWKRLTAEQKKLAIAALPAYTADCQQHGIAYKYAQGWLNGHRWEDHLDEDVSPCQNASGNQDGQKESAESAPVAPSPVRTGDRLTAQDLQAFAAMKEQLLQAWSRHKDEANAVGLRKLMNDLELHGVNDFHKMVQFRSVRTTFNREFTLPWFWEPSVFDSIVAECFNGYRWVATV